MQKSELKISFSKFYRHLYFLKRWPSCKEQWREQIFNNITLVCIALRKAHLVLCSLKWLGFHTVSGSVLLDTLALAWEYWGWKRRSALGNSLRTCTADYCAFPLGYALRSWYAAVSHTNNVKMIVLLEISMAYLYNEMEEFGRHRIQYGLTDGLEGQRIYENILFYMSEPLSLVGGVFL